MELLTLVIATGRSLGEVYEQFSLTSPFVNIFSKTVLGLLETEVGRGGCAIALSFSLCKELFSSRTSMTRRKVKFWLD